jgi:hypothetical protein
VVDEVARPCGAKTILSLWLFDAQVYLEEAIRATQDRDTERALRCMKLAREAQRQASGKIEGMR